MELFVVARVVVPVGLFDVMSIHTSLSEAVNSLSPFLIQAAPWAHDQSNGGWQHSQFHPEFQARSLLPSPGCRADVVVLSVAAGSDLMETIHPVLSTAVARLVGAEEDLLSESSGLASDGLASDCESDESNPPAACELQWTM